MKSINITEETRKTFKERIKEMAEAILLADKIRGNDGYIQQD